MRDHQFIRKFITSREIETNRYSCLLIALSDARIITGRNIHTGAYELNMLENDAIFLDPDSFIGAVNYLLILDMIGEIFKSSAFVTKKTNCIFKALKQFSSISEDDIDTIIALRNSLAHNYGLINIPSDKKEFQTKRHKFTFDNSESAELIKYPMPSMRWEGDFTDKSEDSSTVIGYRKLADLVEASYANLKVKFEAGLVSLNLMGGVDELKARFTIRN